MRIHWIKVMLGAMAAEVAAIMVLVCMVAIFGPKEASEAQACAEKLGRWVGPVAGAMLSFIGALWVGRSWASGPLAHGALFGFLMALIDVALLIAMQTPFEWVFVASNAGKIIMGVAGGLIAARFRRSTTTPEA